MNIWIIVMDRPTLNSNTIVVTKNWQFSELRSWYNEKTLVISITGPYWILKSFNSNENTSSRQIFGKTLLKMFSNSRRSIWFHFIGSVFFWISNSMKKQIDVKIFENKSICTGTYPLILFLEINMNEFTKYRINFCNSMKLFQRMLCK